jgi:hypothetical protein
MKPARYLKVLYMFLSLQVYCCEFVFLLQAVFSGEIATVVLRKKRRKEKRREGGVSFNLCCLRSFVCVCYLG